MAARMWIGRVLAMAFLAAVVACGTQGAPAPSSIPAAQAPELAAQDYRLGPGDQLRIVVFGQSDLTGQFVVNPQGQVAYPLIGEVRAAGQTIPEFTQALTAALQQGYVRQPNVVVEVTTYRPFYILGEVDKPGTYPFSAGLTVIRAVATAGGFTYRANSHRVFIMHDNERVEREYELSTTTPVQPGDTVRIPERRF